MNDAFTLDAPIALLPEGKSDKKPLDQPEHRLSRICTRCKLEKPLDGFQKDKSGRGGMKSYCRECGRLYCKEWHARNLEKSKARSRSWYVRNHDAALAYAASYHAANKEIESAKQKDRRRRDPEAARARDSKNNALAYARNPEKIKSRVRDWVRANRDKVNATHAARHAKKRGSGTGFRGSDIRAPLSLQKSKCAHSWCRRSLKGGFHVDHIMPLSRSGPNDRRNIQLLCAPCNLRKSARHPIDFAQRHGVLL